MARQPGVDAPSASGRPAVLQQSGSARCSAPDGEDRSSTRACQLPSPAGERDSVDRSGVEADRQGHPERDGPDAEEQRGDCGPLMPARRRSRLPPVPRRRRRPRPRQGPGPTPPVAPRLAAAMAPLASHTARGIPISQRRARGPRYRRTRHRRRCPGRAGPRPTAKGCSARASMIFGRRDRPDARERLEGGLVRGVQVDPAIVSGRHAARRWSPAPARRPSGRRSSGCARFSDRPVSARSTRGPNPPAASMASPTRSPGSRRTSPGRTTAPPTSTTISATSGASGRSIRCVAQQGGARGGGHRPGARRGRLPVRLTERPRRGRRPRRARPPPPPRCRRRPPPA